ncbi:MAG: twin-arginine translocase TatA/TatE family subunit [Anaerolineae bacterium]|jgi:sec-independent protein translocase protein TatB
MNIFSNIGITELVVILLLALLVVGPERLPEMGRKLAEILRDVRRAYDNLTAELGPELQSIQKTTQELRESVDSVRSIPQDTLKSVVSAADLDDTIAELKGVTTGLEEVRQTVNRAGKTMKDPVGAAVGSAREALLTPKQDKDGESDAPEGAAEQTTEKAKEETIREADEASQEQAGD